MQQAILRFDVKASVYYGKGDIRALALSTDRPRYKSKSAAVHSAPRLRIARKAHSGLA